MKIAIATTTRADWGLLLPLASELRNRGHEPLIMAGGMHFDPRLGLTINQVKADGFSPVLECAAQGSPAEIAAACLTGFYESLSEHKPDCLVCLGDRFEMLAIAEAANLAHVPIVHIAGGAISEGAFDDSFRHAITKLAFIHLAECEQYRQRIISMGENPERVFNTGAIGIHNMMHAPEASPAEMRELVGFDIDKNTIICTMHAATLEPSLTPLQQYGELLAALAEMIDEMPQLKVVFTYPNNDVDPAPLIEALTAFQATHPERISLVPSFGMRRYVTALRSAGAMIGNSSSGIVEAASAGLPILDIGIRQQGRMVPPSFIHAECNKLLIAKGIRDLLSEKMRNIAAKKINPYAKPDTPAIMADIILSTDFSNPIKKFYEPCASSL